MRNMIWSLVAVASVLVLGAPEANAGATCTIIPSMCPPPSPGSGGKGSSVPEPATLAVLAAGAAAAGIANRRRKK